MNKIPLALKVILGVAIAAVIVVVLSEQRAASQAAGWDALSAAESAGGTPDALDKASQAAVLKAAADAEARGWKLSEEKNGWYLAQLKDKGMVIVAPSEQLTADLRKVGNYMLAEWLRKSGDDGRKVIDAYRGM